MALLRDGSSLRSAWFDGFGCGGAESRLDGEHLLRLDVVAGEGGVTEAHVRQRVAGDDPERAYASQSLMSSSMSSLIPSSLPVRSVTALDSSSICPVSTDDGEGPTSNVPSLMLFVPSL